MTVYRDVKAALGLDEPRLPARPVTRRPAPRSGRAGRPQHAPRVPFALLLVSIVAGGLGLLLLLNTASAANEVRRHDLAAQDASISAKLQQLQIDVAASAAPGNLAAAAAALGMVPAGNPAFLVVGPSGSVTVMGHPARVTDAAAVIPAKTSASKSPSKSASKSSSKSASNSKSAGKSAGNSKSASNSKSSEKSAHHGPKNSAGTSPSSTPTSTPTPTVVLPGGDR